MSALSVMAAKCLIADGYDALHRAFLCVGVQGLKVDPFSGERG
jgi:hypothetical protein